MFDSETLSPCIYMHIILTYCLPKHWVETTSEGSVLFQQNNASCQTVKKIK